MLGELQEEERQEELQELLGVRAKRFAAGRPVTMTQGYAAYLRVHGIPRQRHASFSPQVTTPHSRKVTCRKGL